MGIRIERKLVAFDSVTLTEIDPSYLCIDEEELEKYMKEHPMPKDPEYSEIDLKTDILSSSGMYTLPRKTKPKTVSYVEDLLNALVK